MAARTSSIFIEPVSPGSMIWTSGYVPRTIRRQAAHSPQPSRANPSRSANGVTQLNACATAIAANFLPTPSGPERTRLGISESVAMARDSRLNTRRCPATSRNDMTLAASYHAPEESRASSLIRAILTRMRAVVVSAFAVTLTALVACGRSSPREVDAEPSVPVIAEPVRLGSIRSIVSATGVVSTLPGASLTITAPQPARIAAVTKNVGDPVKAGETLVQFELPSLTAQMAVDAATVKAADLRVQQ